ncbi:sugar phosphate isomerase/epimerase family protein [Streptomyces millisiae]|uniref:Sugar phosphate isomerase/epimerase family protein n=1 Tax=Streptomyces millisiae TaxID=3075542 RepID=A0ABU2LK85_9ACTN|nr:sugar phosphate isomerase/epimerase family protein [Streptomyces sp. DSM 44918]MDT0317658.1 sugar phosphate isomerase/epimerase family protein [Streptomyces sp. DSM 44918]
MTAEVGSTEGPIELGLCLAALAPAGLEGALAAAGRAGVRVVDLPADSTFGLVAADRAEDPGYHAALRARLAAAGVAVGCVSNSRDTQLLLGPHGPQTDPVLAGPAEAKRAHGLRAALATVRLAAGLGAPLARLMLGVPDLSRWLSWWGSDVSWQDNVDAWARAAEPILELAAASGVRVVVEPHPKQVAYDPASARALLAAAAGVGLCVDPANLAAVGHDPVRAVRGWGERLAAVHAKDLQWWREPGDPVGAGWSRYGPGPAIRFRALGAGELPWPAIVAALLDEGYRGVLYVEHEDALLPTAQGVANSLALLRGLLPHATAEGRTW